MTDTIQYLRNPTLPLDKALQADVRELIGMTDSAAQALEDAMQIHTIGDLAMSTYFDFAYQVVNSIEDPNHKFVKIGLPQDRLTNSWRKKGAAEVANANLDAIEGLGKKRFELLVEALGVTTVREMAYWPPYLHARQILEDTQSGSLLSRGRQQDNPVDSDQWIVKGNVRTQEGDPAPNLKVNVYFRQLIKQATLLGSAETNDEGYYEVNITDSAETMELSFGGLDIFVSLFDEEKKLAESLTVINVGKNTKIDLIAPSPKTTPITLFKKIENKINPLLNGELPEKVGKEDIEYLSNKLEVKEVFTNQYVLAHKLANQSKELSQSYALDAEIIFAISGENADMNLTEMVSLSEKDLRFSIAQSLKNNRYVLPENSDVEKLVSRIKNLQVDLVELEANNADLKKFIEVLDVASDIDPTQRRLILLNYLSSESYHQPWELPDLTESHREFLKTSELVEYNVALVNALKKDTFDTYQLAKRGHNEWHQFLLDNQVDVPGKEHPTAEDIEEYARYLKSILSEKHPVVAVVYDLLQDEKIEDHAKPKEKLIEFLDSHPDFDFTKTSINKFLKKLPVNDKYSASYTSENETGKELFEKFERKAVIAGLEQLESAFFLVPDGDKAGCMATLLTLDLRKAKSGTREGVQESEGVNQSSRTPFSVPRIANSNQVLFAQCWIEARKKRLGVDDKNYLEEAKYISNRARYAVFSAILPALNSYQSIDPVTPALVPLPKPTARKSTLLRANEDSVANLNSLFGERNQCECQHCQSVYSAAAYLAHLFSDVEPLHESLFDRRPDIAKLQTSCENTHIKLPYIDLAIEALEFLFARNVGLSGITSNRQTHWLEEDLELKPEYEDPKIYSVMSGLIFPIALGWDKWFVEAQLYLKEVGTSFAELSESFIPLVKNIDIGMGLQETIVVDWPNYRMQQITDQQSCLFRLGLTETVFKFITTTDIESGSDAYIHWDPGLNHIFNITSLDEVKPLNTFMARLGLWAGDKICDDGKWDYLLFNEIIGCSYIQETVASDQAAIHINYKNNEYKIESAEVLGLTTETIFRLLKFEHLRKALGWNPKELNLFLETFRQSSVSPEDPVNNGDIANVLIATLSTITTLKNTLNSVAIDELLSWWGIVDTGVYHIFNVQAYGMEETSRFPKPLYERVFLKEKLGDAKGFSPSNSKKYFILNSEKTELSYLIDNVASGLDEELVVNHSAYIGAALGIEIDDLRLFIRYLDPLSELVLNLDNLSKLYRLVSLKNAVMLSATELLILCYMYGSTEKMDFFDSPSSSLMFVEMISDIKSLPLTIQELAFHLNIGVKGKEETYSLQSESKLLLQKCKNTISELSRLNQNSYTKTEPSKQTLYEQLAIIGYSGNDIDYIAKLLGLWKSSNASKLLSYFKFLTKEHLRELSELGNGEEYLNVENKPLVVALSKAIAPYCNIISGIQHLLDGSLSLLPISVVKAFMVDGWRSDAVEKECMIYAFFRRFSGYDVGEEILESHLLRICRAYTLVRRLNIKEPELSYISEHKEQFYGLSLIHIAVDSGQDSKLTLAQLAALARYLNFRKEYASNPTYLVELFKLSESIAKTKNNKKKILLTQKLIQSVAELIGVTEGDTKEILSRLGCFSNSIADNRDEMLVDGILMSVDSLLPLTKLASVSMRFGCSESRLYHWVNDIKQDQSGLSLISAWDWSDQSKLEALNDSDLLNSKQITINELKNTLEGKYAKNQWLSLTRKIQSSMRRLKRDKLLAAITQSYISLNNTTVSNLTTVSNVYDYLLLDPLINPCMQTTRLKQSISSLQLLIQRALMGLEGESVQSEIRDLLEEQWDWKNNYRLWEAQQKVLLYPENWIEPELRDDKSPFFKDFESDLAQGGLDGNNIEKAFKSYLAKLESVAQLDVVATHQEYVVESRSNIHGVLKEQSVPGDLHVVGMKKGVPNKFYFRTRKQTGVWTAWSRIDLDIDSEFVLITTHKGRLYIIWPTFKESTRQMGQEHPTDEEYNKYNIIHKVEIYLNWSRFENDRWVAKNVMTQSSVLLHDGSYTGSVRDSILYNIDNSGNEIVVNLSVIGAFDRAVRYLWDSPKLNEVLLSVKNIPFEINWSHVVENSLIDPIVIGQFAGNVEYIQNAVAQLVDQAKLCLLIELYKGDEHAFYIHRNLWIEALKYFLVNESVRLGMAGLVTWLEDNGQLRERLEKFINIELSINVIKNVINYIRIDNHINSGEQTESSIFSKVTIDSNAHSSVRNMLGVVSMPICRGVSSKTECRSEEIDIKESKINILNSAQGHSVPFVSIENGTNVSISIKNNSVLLESRNSEYKIRFKRGLHTNMITVSPNTSSCKLIFDSKSIFLVASNASYYFRFRENDQEGDKAYICEPFYHAEMESYGAIVDDLDRGDLLLRANDILALNSVSESVRTIGIDLENNVSFAECAHKLSFLRTMPYGAYNWEIFFHVPLSIAVRLSQDKQFEKAMSWFHFIFNPLKSTSVHGQSYDDSELKRDPSHYWNFLPFHSPDAIAGDISINDDELTLDPFQPYRVARSRPAAFQKAVVMKYLDNLIAWGDDLFAKDTLESINAAANLYILATKILGERPKLLPLNVIQVNNLAEHHEGQNGQAGSEGGDDDENGGVTEVDEIEDNDLQDDMFWMNEHLNENLNILDGRYEQIAKVGFQIRDDLLGAGLDRVTLGRVEREVDFVSGDVVGNQSNPLVTGGVTFVGVDNNNELEEDLQVTNEGESSGLSIEHSLNINTSMKVNRVSITLSTSGIGESFVSVAAFDGGQMVYQNNVQVSNTQQIITITAPAIESVSINRMNGGPRSARKSTNSLQVKSFVESRLNRFPAFCIPYNSYLLKYWDKVADRMFKIRNCRNASGQTRDLPIFEPPIDPALLVRARALGMELSDVLSEYNTATPAYRFRTIYQKALEFTSDVQNLGSGLLSAYEKRDAEELVLLRSKHERDLLRINRSLRLQQIEERRESVSIAQKSWDLVNSKFEFYSSREFANRNERAQTLQLFLSNAFNQTSESIALAASLAYPMPQVKIGAGPPESEQGGLNAGGALTAVSKYVAMLGNSCSVSASLHGIHASLERRMDDWVFQAEQAKIELAQQERNILASEIRLAMAEHELKLHEQQEEQSDQIADYYREKFTNKELFNWMVSETSEVYSQSYKLALNLALMAEKCFKREMRREDVQFISPGFYWDKLSSGLLAGERLQLDLRRMEMAYLENNKRVIEITKSLSLKRLAPIQLDELRLKGECLFSVSELIFDLDYPGHYERRIKSLRVSIPGVIGPLSTMACQFTVSKSGIKQSDGTYKSDNEIPQSVTLSSGQNDSGVFELNHNDERYLPFELRGVSGDWYLKFESKYPSFDRTTISDVVFEVQYTALDGGMALAQTTNDDIAIRYNAASTASEKAMGLRIDIKREYSDFWYQFKKEGRLQIPIEKSIFPYLVQPVLDHVDGVGIRIVTNRKLSESLTLGDYSIGNPDELADGLCIYSIGPQNLITGIDLNQLGADKKTIDLTLNQPLANSDCILELVLVLFYKIKT